MSNIFLNFKEIFLIKETIIYHYDNNIKLLFLFFLSLLLVNFFPNTQQLSYAFAPKMNIYKKEISDLRISIYSNYKKFLIAIFTVFLFYLNLSQLININEYIYFRF